MADKKKSSTDEVREFWARHGKDIPPREPRAEPRSVLNDEIVEGVSVSPPPPRANKTDAPAEYDPETGRMLDDLARPAIEIAEDAEDRWIRMATDLAALFVQTSEYHEHVEMPVARLPEPARRPTIQPRVLEALPELEALHRRLIPGWRDIARGWLEGRARARVEQKYRPAWDREANAGKRYNLLDERMVLSAMSVHEVLLGKGAPAALSATVVECLGELVTLKGKGSGGMTVDTAMEKLDEWARDPEGDEAAKAHLRAQQAAKKKRRKSKQE